MSNIIKTQKGRNIFDAMPTKKDLSQVIKESGISQEDKDLLLSKLTKLGVYSAEKENVAERMSMVNRKIKLTAEYKEKMNIKKRQKLIQAQYDKERYELHGAIEAIQIQNNIKLIGE